MTFLLGRQATFGQEPPTSAHSTTTVFWPWLARVHARILPATPLPITRFSTCSMLMIVPCELPERPATSPATSLPRGEPVHLFPAALLSVGECHKVSYNEDG